MAPKAPAVVLDKSQAACLAAFRDLEPSTTTVAITAKLDTRNATLALDRLEKLGFVERENGRRWYLTAKGRAGRFTVAPKRVRPDAGELGTTGRRLLALLERPMRGDELADRLGVTRQRVHQLVVQLSAKGSVRFGDPRRILHIVARSEDETALLSRQEESVLSSVPNDYATSAKKIGIAAHRPTRDAQLILKGLVAKGLVQAQKLPSETPSIGRVPSA